MKKWLFLLAVLCVAALPEAQAQGGRGFWHQEWTVEKGDSIPLVYRKGAFGPGGPPPCRSMSSAVRWTCGATAGWWTP